MKKFMCLLLVLLLLAVPVSAQWDLLYDGEGLLTTEEAIMLESDYADFAANCGFTPILVTTDSFEGKDPDTYAGNWYDSHGYPEDGILLLVSLTEGQWYILTNGACYDRIPNWEAEMIGEELVAYLRAGEFYEAFALFPELALDAYSEDSSISSQGGADAPATHQKHYGKTIAICMAVGMVIGLIAVGIMAAQMKSVRAQNAASDYVRPGSMHLTNRRDIFLYSHVSRTPKPKPSSGGSHGGGGSRGGAGGRI